jgi:hypothetical protein
MAVLTAPKCKEPVGLGANLVTVFMSKSPFIIVY